MKQLGMGLGLAALVGVGFTACGKSAPKPGPIPKEQVSSDRPSIEVPVSEKQPSTAGSPAQLYEQCFERVEGLSVDGECEVDADCVTTGCSAETCMAAKNVEEGMMGTCEILPCFSVLDTCGCVQGRCSWSLKDAMPAGPLKGFLPANPK